jgi:hypothetical protein
MSKLSLQTRINFNEPEKKTHIKPSFLIRFTETVFPVEHLSGNGQLEKRKESAKVSLSISRQESSLEPTWTGSITILNGHLRKA